MSNKYRLNNNLSIIEEQAKKALKITKEEMETKADALSKVIESVRNFFANIGKPSVKYRQAYQYGPPYSSDYNKTINEIYDDLNTIWESVKTLEEGVVASFNYSQTERSLIQNEFQKVKDKLKDYVLLSDVSSSNVLIARDSFNDRSKINTNRIYGTIADIDTAAGCITLAKVGTTNHASKTKIKIEKGAVSNKRLNSGIFGAIADNLIGNNSLFGNGSNGFAGNFHEVTTETDQYGLESNNIKFVGESNPHADITACIDDNPDTWFEYELVNLPDKYKDNPCKQFGFSFDAGKAGQIRWDIDPPFNNKVGKKQLRLRTKLVLNTPETINSIVISPYTPPNDGATKPFDVEDILISPDGIMPLESIFSGGVDNNNGLSTVNEEDIKTGDRVFMFPKRIAKVIEIQFTQDTKYDINVGHIYYNHIVTIKTTKKRFLRSTKRSYETTITRIDGPNIPLSATGVISEKVGGGALGEALDYIATGIGETFDLLLLGGIGSIFGKTTKEVTENRVEQGVEQFSGWRYCIGIKDIKILSTKYAEQSEIISVPFHSDNTIYKVSLRVNDEIPKAFQDENPYNWIKYYISHDCSTWYRISPQGYPEIFDENNELIPEIYTFNSLELEDSRAKNVGYIETSEPVNDVFLKIILTRPTNMEDSDRFTPVVYDYALRLYTEGDNI